MAEQFIIPTRGDLIAGKYLIQEELGRGSYGVVFRAKQLGVDRDVALKTLLPQAFLQSDIVERFQREAALVSRLHHPNIITLFDFGESDGLLYMVMEFIQGRSLADVIKHEAPISPRRAVHLLSQVLHALQAAHQQGIVHRDLKPENIVLCQMEDEPEFVKVLDFGIAKLTAGPGASDALRTLTVQGYVLGTPYYMAPEVITGEGVSHQADLYAVGLLLYELLVGKHPYESPNPSAVLVKHLSDPVPTLPDPELARGPLGYAVRRALAKEPAERVEDAAAFLGLLQAAAPPRSQWQSPLVLAAAGLFLLTALMISGGLTWLLLRQLSSAPADAPPAAEVAPPQAPSPPAEAASVEVKAPPPAEVAPPVEAAPAVVEVAPEEPAVVKEERPRKAPNAPVQVSFASEPAGAQVLVNGAPVCTAPCSRSWPGDQTLRVRFTKIGYEAQARTVDLQGGARRVEVKLRPGRIRLIP